MAAPTADDLAGVLALLREGKTQAADDLLTTHHVAARDAENLAAGLPAEPPPPRLPEEIIMAFFEAVTALLGTPGKLEVLLAELKAVAAKL